MKIFSTCCSLIKAILLVLKLERMEKSQSGKEIQRETGRRNLRIHLFRQRLRQSSITMKVPFFTSFQRQLKNSKKKRKRERSWRNKRE
jgi:hypothetical protein